MLYGLVTISLEKRSWLLIEKDCLPQRRKGRRGYFNVVISTKGRDLPKAIVMFWGSSIGVIARSGSDAAI